jgi:hypothetical protein
MQSCQQACEMYRKKDYKAAFELLLVAEKQVQKSPSQTVLFHSTLLKRIQQNIAVCRTFLDKNLDCTPFKSMLDRKGKTKVSQEPVYTFCSRFNYAIILYHQSKYQEALDLTESIVANQNVFFLKGLLFQLECYVKLGNNHLNAARIIDTISQISHYHLPPDWVLYKPAILKLLNARLLDSTRRIPVLQIPTLSGYEYLNTLCINMNVIATLETPVETSQYLLEYSKSISLTPILFRSFYDAIFYYYLSVVNEILQCRAASQIYLSKSEQFVRSHILIFRPKRCS